MSKMTFLFMVAATVMGIVTFSSKQKVALLSSDLYQLNQRITMLNESKRIYNAEWNYLNEPSRLQRLVDNHLHMTIGRGGNQLAMIQDIINLQKAPYNNATSVQLASIHRENVHEKSKR